jgi:eukaryotic-like serine/threonine-protein kinase
MHSTLENPLDPNADVTEVGTATSDVVRPRHVREVAVGLPPGTVVGRYVVEAIVGSGGMGVVFRARDSGLDRVVALKRLYPEQVAAHGEGRLLREARAMAQLSHPNVVSVYGVERWEGSAVLAMEFVEGRTLDQWLRGSHEPAEGLRLMLEAGEGLRAAHDAGIIHRDFKPSNVLVGNDGRARVVDFGLARADPLAEEPLGSMPGEGSFSMADDPQPEAAELRTEAGRIMGTVAYMAPEQLLGMPADARSDQFAFCISLWEVLCGGRPFQGHVYASLEAKLGGPPPWPTERRTPLRLVAAIRRGLSPQPERRWPSMAALLEQLHARRRPVRRLAPWLALAAGLGLVASLALRREEATAPPCTGAAENLVGVWGDDRRGTIQQALTEAGEVHRRDTWPRVERRLDAWATAWITAHTEACEATSVRGEATEAELDERMACLRDARRQLHGVLATLAQPSAAERAVELVAGLPDAARCLDVEVLDASGPPVTDPELRARVDAHYESLIAVQTLLNSGRVREASVRLDALVEPARALDWAPGWIETLMLRALIARSLGDFAAAERDLVEAHALATSKGLPLHAVRAAEKLIPVVGLEQGRYDEAMTLAEAALALVRREPSTADHEADVLREMAVVLYDRGKYAQSAELQRRVLELRELEGDPLDLATAIETQGSILERLGRPREAIEHHRRTLEIRERELGPEHLSVATSLNDLAVAMLAAGDEAQALPLLERVLRIRERALGPDNVQLVSVLNNLGLAHMAQRSLADAESYLLRALSLLEGHFPEGHQHVGSALINLGMLRSDQGRIDEAQGFYERGLAMWERTLGPAHPKVGLALDNLGNLALGEERPRVALGRYRRALEIREAALGGDHPLVVASLVHLGIAFLDLGDARSARPLLERAERWAKAQPEGDPEVHGIVALAMGRLLLEEGQAARAVALLERALSSHLASRELADTQLLLARALWDGGGDRARAEVLAREAHASSRALENQHGAQRAERWLAEHGAARR